MINSKNLILSSSTFSWWAAKLNKDIENIYIPTMLQQHLGNPKIKLKLDYNIYTFIDYT